MVDKALSLQDWFLNSVRRSKSPATIFLLKGVKLQGVITWFDAFSLLLRRDAASQLVYKHAISTVMPLKPIPDLPDQVETASAGSGRRPLQDLFLAAAAREQGQMTLFLVNGVMLQGTISGFDQFSVVLRRESQVQLVYKHAISTLQPAHALTLDVADPDEAPATAPDTGE
jgi:host factor-I protein